MAIALRKEKTEFFVGLFVLVGLVIMGTLIIQFGRFSERLREKYELTLLFPDGGDIIDGSPVRLGGAQVGIVADSPQLNDDSTGVIIGLEIYDGKKIPAGADFAIATSGLMGDSYIRIVSPKKPSGEFITEGTTIDGAVGSSLSDFTKQGGNLLDDLSAAVVDIREAVESLDASFQKIEKGVLSTDNIENLSGTLADFKSTGGSIKEAGEKLVPAVEKGGEAMEEAKAAIVEIKSAVAAAKKTFDTATGVVEKAEPAVEDFSATLAELRDAAKGINEAVSKITEGEGVLAALISDDKVKRDLESLISNLNEHGIIGYKNDHAKRNVEARTQPQSEGTTTTKKKGLFNWFGKKND
jgi:phospholipid/cholesterol/gamma-HCH transport system substrate-binding protein